MLLWGVLQEVMMVLLRGALLRGVLLLRVLLLRVLLLRVLLLRVLLQAHTIPNVGVALERGTRGRIPARARWW